MRHWTPARDESALFAPRREAPKGVILSDPCAVFPALNGELKAVNRAATICTSTSYVFASTLPCIIISKYAAVVDDEKVCETVACAYVLAVDVMEIELFPCATLFASVSINFKVPVPVVVTLAAT